MHFVNLEVALKPLLGFIQEAFRQQRIADEVYKLLGVAVIKVITLAVHYYY